MPFDIADSFIIAAEKTLGATLPSSYRASMLRRNGGELETGEEIWAIFPIADTSNRKRVSRTANHFVKETSTCQGWKNFPQDALAIASNGAGDCLVFIRQGNSYRPNVYRWSHETGSITQVANDFSLLKEEL